MKSHSTIIDFFGDCAMGRFVDSFLQTATETEFSQFLDFSKDKKITISSDYGGEDPGSEYFIYSATFSTFNSTQKWLASIRTKFDNLGYSSEPQYKEISPNSNDGKFIDFIKISNQDFKGFVVALAIPKTIISCFAKSLEDSRNIVINNSGIDNYGLSDKNTEKAMRVSTLISIVLYKIIDPTAGYYWLSDRDAITKITDNQNFYNNTLRLQINMISNFLDEEISGLIGYSLPWEGENGFQSYAFIALNDLFAGSLADVLSSQSPKNKSCAILHYSHSIPKFFFKIDYDDGKYSACRVKINVEKS